MIISVHTPKCGGSSFKELLEEHYESNFVSDYKDKPLNKTKLETIEKAKIFYEKLDPFFYKKELCIHGHFLPFKYSKLLEKPNVYFVTWLRNPAERLASNYFYWKRTENTNHKKNFGEIRKKMHLENWSLERFCFSQEFQNLYSYYFWNFPIDKFHFVGITEYYDAEIKHFVSEFLGKTIMKIPYENVNLNKPKSYFKDIGFVNELKSFHAVDYALYNHALEKRRNRLNRDSKLIY